MIYLGHCHRFIRCVKSQYMEQISVGTLGQSVKLEKVDRKLIAFGWYGGKYSHLDWLLPLLPEATHYCEPFGGSAAVLINRKPSPVETYNDVHGEVVTFFRVLRTRLVGEYLRDNFWDVRREGVW